MICSSVRPGFSSVSGWADEVEMEAVERKRGNTIGNVANEHYLPGCGAVGWHLDGW